MSIFPGVELGGSKDSHLWKLYISFQRWESLEPLPPWGGGWIDICARGFSCTKFNFEQLLFKAFFDAMRIFGGVEPFSRHFDLICLDNSPNMPF